MKQHQDFVVNKILITRSIMIYVIIIEIRNKCKYINIILKSIIINIRFEEESR
jgi:hypothetical protein